MNNNERYFKQKFEECARFLNVSPTKLVSLKYRELRYNDYYVDLLHHLKNVNGIYTKDIGLALNGHAYLVSHGEQNIILVEHETGLEILYIAGSIASLIGLVLQIGSMVGSHRGHYNSPPPHPDDVEVRYFDEAGNLVEEHRHDYFPYEVFLPSEVNRTEIKRLTKRVAALERKLKMLTEKPAKRRKK